MAVSKLPQAPFRQDRKLFPTPIIGDVLFSEVRDCNRVDPFPEYGTPHPNPAKWPHHKLVYIKPIDIDRNEIYEFFYAAERENQDLYNFASGYRNVIGNVGGREFRIVQRSYVNLRENFSPLDIPFGEPMPDIPEGVFDGIDYVFFDRQQKPIAEIELNALFIAEEHTYIETAFLELNLAHGAQKSDVIPERFRAQIPQVSTDQIIEGLASPPFLSGGQLSVTEDQINPDIKLVKTVSRDFTGDVALPDGKKAYIENITGGTVSEKLSTSPEIEKGLLIAGSESTAIGDGKFIVRTEKADSWPLLRGSRYNEELNAPVEVTQQMVNPGEFFTTDPNVTFSSVNEDRSLRITEVVPVAELESFLLGIPTRVNLDIPAILESVSVIWTVDESIGAGEASGDGVNIAKNGGTISAEVQADGQGSFTSQPTVSTTVKTIVSKNLPATSFFFFAKLTDGVLSDGALAAALSRAGGPTANPWPTFKPLTHQISTLGATVQASAKANVSQSKTETIDGIDAQSKSQSKGFTASVNRTFNQINIGPVINAALQVENANQVTRIFAISSATAKLTGDFDVAETESSMAQVGVFVSPLSLQATTPSSVPTSGHFIVDSSADLYKYGYIRCSATVLNANIFA